VGAAGLICLPVCLPGRGVLDSGAFSLVTGRFIASATRKKMACLVGLKFKLR
jgi:hypothetical protein